MKTVVRLVFSCMWCRREHQVLELRGVTRVRTRVHESHVRHAYCDGCAVYLLTIENRLALGLPILDQSLEQRNELKLIAPRALSIFGEVRDLRA